MKQNLFFGLGAALVLLFVGCLSAFAAPQVGDYEGRVIAAIDIVFENSPPDPAAQSEFASALQVVVGGQYSAAKIHDSIYGLHEAGLVSSVRVEVSPAAANNPDGPVRVRFIVRRQLRLSATRIEITGPARPELSVDEIRGRLNLLESGAPVTEAALKSNAELIQAYLRDHGFYRANVEYSQQQDPSDPTGTRIIVTFRIAPNERATVSSFTIDIKGFDPASVRPTLKFQPGAPFSQQALAEDIATIRDAILALGYLAPQLEDPRISLDTASNKIAIALAGSIGPRVDVTVKNYELKPKTMRELLPVLREGNIDPSAVVEGERRLRNRFQEEGYFFAEVTPICAVAPPVAGEVEGTQERCNTINPAELTGKTVNITYNVELGRRFKLTDIRIEGTNKLSLVDIEDELRSQKANALGFIPYLGYGRGYTSLDQIEQDRRTVQNRMRDLGYRRADVEARQGVALTGDNLIITFNVTEGPLTRVAGVDIRGNKIFTVGQLKDAIKEGGDERCRNRAQNYISCFATVVGAPFSRTQARADGDSILRRYASRGYVDAKMDFAIVELPTRGDDEQVRLVYTIRDEGDKVFINNIIINGLVRTDPQAIRRAIPLKEGELLRVENLNESERILYATDAFRQVIIHTEPAGDTTSGFKKRDVIIDVEELKHRILNYGGGYSTDNGPLGFVAIRNVNLFGRMEQGALRIRLSSLQQSVGLEYINPRFQPYGKTKFSPLTLSVQYDRDTTVTRFFRSTIDQGNNGIVQRLDADGNPIDQFGNPIREPSENRFTFNAETQRSFDEKGRTLFIARYSYQDVRLYNLGSLLVEDLLRPDRKIRISMIGAAFARETRDSQFDPTRGDYFNVDYQLALRQLGGNISFNRLLVNYRRYKLVPKLRRTILAGNITLGLANVINPRDRDDIPGITEADLRLPISERFFSGGSTTLRGFNYEEAGPREVVPDCTGEPDFATCFKNFGVFRDSHGDIVQFDPFTVPIGGNAMAIANLEARIPVTRFFQIVPFYDGGNVYRNVGELFGKNDPTINPNLRSKWTHTVGLGIGVRTPLGGTLSIDYGFLLNPPEFILPQANNTTAIYRLGNGRIHFRFTRSF